MTLVILMTYFSHISNRSTDDLISHVSNIGNIDDLF